MNDNLENEEHSNAICRDSITYGEGCMVIGCFCSCHKDDDEDDEELVQEDQPLIYSGPDPREEYNPEEHEGEDKL